MPSVSKKQHNLMAAVAHSPKFAKKVGIKQSVGREFIDADKGKKFGTGGDVNYTYGGKGQVNKQRTRGGSIYGVQKNIPNENLNQYVGKKEGGTVATKKLFGGKETRAEEMKEAKALKSGKISKAQYVAGEKSEGHGKGAGKTASAIKSGKITPAQYAKAETMMKKGGCAKMAKGGKADVKIAMSSKKAPAVAPTMPTMPGAPRGMTPPGSPMMGRAPAAMPQRPAAPMMAKGGMTAGKAAHAQKEGKRVAKEMEYDYKTGKKSFAGTTAQKDAHAEKEGRKVAKAMEYDYSKGRKMASGGLAAGHKTADGVAVRGKTRGTEVKMARGGKTKKYC